MKLRLIAGVINVYEPEEGWKNIHLDITTRGIWDRDLDMAVQPQFVADITDLGFFRSEMFDAVQLWHVLEHLPEHRGNQALREIHRILKSDGTLDIEVPDVERVMRAWFDGQLDYRGLQQWLYGEDIADQGNEADFHRHGWTETHLRDCLSAERFKIVEEPDTGLAVRFVCEKISR